MQLSPGRQALEDCSVTLGNSTAHRHHTEVFSHHWGWKYDHDRHILWLLAVSGSRLCFWEKHVFVGSPRYYRSSIIAFVFLPGFYQRKSVSVPLASDSSKADLSNSKEKFLPPNHGRKVSYFGVFLIWIQFHFHFSSPITFPFTHYSLPSRIGATILSAITHICNFECCISASSLSNPILRVGCFASMCYSPLKPKPNPIHTPATLRVAFLLLAFPAPFRASQK